MKQPPHLRPLLRVMAISAACLASACTVGPDYQQPKLDLPPNWSPNTWTTGQPADQLPKGDWWQVYDDAQLDHLQGELDAHNASLTLAQEHLAQARTQVQLSRANLMPQVNATLGTQRSSSSADRPLASYTVNNVSTTQNDFNAGFVVRYETDLFGGIRRQLEAAKAGAEQAEAELRNAQLILHAELTADYFSLCELDNEIQVVKNNLRALASLRDLINSRHELGSASALDLSQAQAQLDAASSQLNVLQGQRAQFEHAIAVLLGQSAPDFHLPQTHAAVRTPNIPAGVPAHLLQRRPDVASAERAMAAANARVGVATAAYFPDISLGTTLGSDANQLSHLLTVGSVLWSLGASATQMVFDGGRVSANVAMAQSDYRSTVAQYRLTVLTAMQEVEDGLSNAQQLGQASKLAQDALDNATHYTQLTQTRYDLGLASRADLLNAEQSQLQFEKQKLQLDMQYKLASVYLIKALGGVW